MVRPTLRKTVLHEVITKPLLTFLDGSVVDPQRSRTMSRVRGKDTRPEIVLRRALWSREARFRCHTRTVPGRPDICNQRAKVAVFVDGCFWHGCPRHYRPPKTRVLFWAEKVRRNKARRRQVRDALKGWSIFEVYECEIKADIQAVAAEVARAIRKSI